MNNKNGFMGWMVSVALFSMSAAAWSAEKPADLRKQIVKVEREFFALYNEVNADPQYDIVCRTEKPTGSNFATRVCQPRYVEAAQRAAASERVHTAIHTAPGADSASSASAPLATDEQYRKNVLDAMNRSAKLRALGDKRDALQALLAERTGNK